MLIKADMYAAGGKVTPNFSINTENCYSTAWEIDTDNALIVVGAKTDDMPQYSGVIQDGVYTQLNNVSSRYNTTYSNGHFRIIGATGAAQDRSYIKAMWL